MKKEILIAIILGLAVGLVITFGVYRASQAMKNAKTSNGEINQELVSPNPVASSVPTSVDAFVVSQPVDESISQESTIRISGQTTANAVVVVYNQTDSEMVNQADANGNFSFPFTLSAGSNVLTIRSLSNDRDPLEVVRTVIYSTADLNQVSVSSASATASPSATPTKKVKPTPGT